MKPRPIFIPHVPFDPVLAEPCFPPVRTVSQEQEEAFQQVSQAIWFQAVNVFFRHLQAPTIQALLKRNQDLTPSENEQTTMSNLVTKVQAVLDALIVSPGNFEACVSSL